MEAEPDSGLLALYYEPSKWVMFWIQKTWELPLIFLCYKLKPAAKEVKQKPLEISYSNKIVKSTIFITPYQMLKHQR